MRDHAWIEGFAGAITVSDEDGVIVSMNRKAAQTFAREGGAALVGTNLLDCHPEPSRAKVAALMADRRTNVYTISKNGVRKLIHQSPWWKDDGTFGGLVELSLEIPAQMPHFDRGG